MARKLRFFKEQMMKAGLSPSARSAGCDDVDLDNLEVCWIFWISRFSFLRKSNFYNLYVVFLGETWRT